MKKTNLLLVVLFLLVVFSFSPPKQVSAEGHEWDKDDITRTPRVYHYVAEKDKREKDKWDQDDFKEDVLSVLGAYNVKFNFKVTTLWAKNATKHGGPERIDLSEKVGSEQRARWYWWVDINNSASTDECWHTWAFTISNETTGYKKDDNGELILDEKGNPIDTFETKAYKATVGDWAQADRWESADDKNKKEFEKGNSCYGGKSGEVNGCHVDLYLIDLKQYILDNCNGGNYDKKLYMHAVTEHLGANGQRYVRSENDKGGPYFTMSQWINGCRFGSSTPQAYASHYNMVLHFENRVLSEYVIYWKEWGTKNSAGMDIASVHNMDNVKVKDDKDKLVPMKKFTSQEFSDDTGLTLHNLNTYFEKNGEPYRIKGIAFVHGEYDEEKNPNPDVDYFWINKTMTEDLAKAGTTKQIEKYSKADSGGVMKNGFANKRQEFGDILHWKVSSKKGIGKGQYCDPTENVIGDVEFEGTDGAIKNRGGDNPEPRKGKNAKAENIKALDGLKGGKSVDYSTLVNYMESFIYPKLGIKCEIYLVYEKFGGSKCVKVHQRVWEWNDGTAGYKIRDEYDSPNLDFPATVDKWSVKENGHKDYKDAYLQEGNYAYPLEKMTYWTATDTGMGPSGGWYKKEGGSDLEKFSGNSDVEPKKWNGRDDTWHNFKEAADALLEQKIKLENDTVHLEVWLDYYQPKTAYAAMYYFRHDMVDKKTKKKKAYYSSVYDKRNLQEWNKDGSAKLTVNGCFKNSSKTEKREQLQGGSYYDAADGKLKDISEFNDQIGINHPDRDVFVFRARNSNWIKDGQDRFYARVPAKVALKSKVKEAVDKNFLTTKKKDGKDVTCVNINKGNREKFFYVEGTKEYKNCTNTAYEGSAKEEFEEGNKTKNEVRKYKFKGLHNCCSKDLDSYVDAAFNDASASQNTYEETTYGKVLASIAGGTTDLKKDGHWDFVNGYVRNKKEPTDTEKETKTEVYVKYYRISLEDLAEDIYEITGEKPGTEEEDGNTWSISGKDGAMTGEFFMMEPIVAKAADGTVIKATDGTNTTVDPKTIYECFKAEGMFDFKELAKDKLNAYRKICYFNSDNACKCKLEPYVWKVRAVESHVTDAKFPGYFGKKFSKNYKEVKKSSLPMGEKIKLKDIPSNNGNYFNVDTENDVRWSARSLAKGTAYIKCYKVDTDDPHITVNLHVGTGTMKPESITSSNMSSVKWTTVNYIDDVVDFENYNDNGESTGEVDKRTYEYKVYPDLKTMAEKIVSAQSDILYSNYGDAKEMLKQFKFLPSIATETWADPDGTNTASIVGKYQAQDDSTEVQSARRKIVAHHVMGIPAADTVLTRVKKLVDDNDSFMSWPTSGPEEDRIPIFGTQPLAYCQDIKAKLLAIEKVDRDWVINNVSKEKKEAVKTMTGFNQVVCNTAGYKFDAREVPEAGPQIYLRDYDDPNIEYYTCRYRWDNTKKDTDTVDIRYYPFIYQGGGGLDVNEKTYTIKHDDRNDCVTIDYYWYRQTNRQTPPTPHVTDEPTVYSWNDIADSKAKEGSGGVYKAGDTLQIHGNIDAKPNPKTKETNEQANIVKKNITIGSKGELILPDGEIAKDKDGNKIYVPNLLGIKADTVPYLTAGQITKHVVTVTYSTMVEQFSAVFAPQSGNKQGGFLGFKDYIKTYHPQVQMVYFKVDYLTAWEPTTSRMYNYAFPRTDGEVRDDEGNLLEADENTRQWKGKNYHVSTKRNTKYTGKCEIKCESTGGCHYYGDDGKFSDTAYLQMDPCNEVADVVENGGSITYVIPDSDTNAMCSEVSKMMDKHKDKFRATSDKLTFKIPEWAKDPGKVDTSSAASIIDQIKPIGSRDVDGTYTILEPGFAGVAVTSNLIPSAVNTADVLNDDGTVASLEFNSANKLDLSSFRVPTSECVSEDLFADDDIEISRNKLNTGWTMDGPPEESKVQIDFEQVGDARQAGTVPSGADFPEKRTVESDDVNKVILHTPIALQLHMKKVSENSLQSALSWKAMVGGPEVFELTLGDEFKVEVDTKGNFQYYGTIDTAKYRKEGTGYDFAFSCPVYSKEKTEDGDKLTYHEANHHFKFYDLDNVTFYVAKWADEGMQDCGIKVEALNVVNTKWEEEDGEEGEEKKKVLKDDPTLLNKRGDDYAANVQNDPMDYYWVYDAKGLFATGQMYDLAIEDISDYPTLQGVFRESGYSRSNYSVNSGKFSYGPRWPRMEDDDTYPIVYGDELGNGSTKDQVSYGPLKTGYKVRYSLDTISSMYNDVESVTINPSFYYIPKGKGVQDAEKVRLFYKQQVHGTTKKLVEIGSEEDRMNYHQVCIGDNEFGINKSVLANTAKLLGYDNPDDFITKVTNSWTYNDVTLSHFNRVFTGSDGDVDLRTMNDGTWVDIPASVNDDTLAKAHQVWYGEFYLPAEVHAVRESDYAALEAKMQTGIDFKEDFWCEDNGYLMVNFDNIAATSCLKVSGDEPAELHKHLLYDATSVGGINAFDKEQRVVEKKDSYGQVFKFNQGDFILYDLAKSAKDDYESAGTH